MKVGFASDLHNHQPEIEKCDLLLIAGDITNYGKEPEIVAWHNYCNYLQRMATVTVFIAGNHDFCYEGIPPFTNKDKSIRYLYNSSTEVGGWKVWGTPHTLRFYDWAFNSSEEEMHEIFSGCPKDTDIILTHGPPRGILDYTADKTHQGSVSLKLLCDEIKPRFCVFGHFHMPAGVAKIGETTYINASVVNEKYKLNGINPIYLEIEK